MELNDPLFLIIDKKNQLFKLLNSINLNTKFSYRRFKNISEIERKVLVKSSIIFLGQQEDLPQYIDKDRIVFIDYENNTNSINYFLLNNFKDYICFPFTKGELYLRIMKILNEKVKADHSIGSYTLFTKTQFLQYNNVKIPVTQSETLILKHLFTNKDPVNIKTLSEVTKITPCCLRVHISRLNTRCLKTYGFRVVKNRYQNGYYIDN